MSISISGYSILPQTSADTPVLAAFLQASKLQLAINRFLWKDWPNETAQRARYINVIESSKDPNATRLKVVEDGSGETVAHLVFTRCKPSTKEAEAAGSGDQKSATPDGVISEVLAMVEERIGSINQVWKDVDHVQLTWIYVRPESRKKGIGSALVRLVVEEARAAGIPLALCAEPPAYPFFVKQGFKNTKFVDIDLTQWGGENCGYGVFRISGMEAK